MGYIIEFCMIVAFALAIIALIAFLIFCILLVILFAPIFLAFMFVVKLFKKELYGIYRLRKHKHTRK